MHHGVDDVEGHALEELLGDELVEVLVQDLHAGVRLEVQAGQLAEVLCGLLVEREGRRSHGPVLEVVGVVDVGLCCDVEAPAGSPVLEGPGRVAGLTLAQRWLRVAVRAGRCRA